MKRGTASGGANQQITMAAGKTVKLTVWGSLQAVEIPDMFTLTV